MMKHMDKFDELKRKVYLLIVPFLIIALLTNHLLLSHHLFIHHIILLGLLACFVGSWLLIYFKIAFRLVEFINLIFLTLLHMMEFLHVLRFDMVLATPVEIGDLVWSPLFFIYIFFSLKDKKGLIYAMIIILSTVIIGLEYESVVHQHLNILIQYYISNIVYIVVLYFSLHLIHGYTESEALRKLAYEDFLTRIPNRQKMNQQLVQSVHKAQNNNSTFSIIFFDIDRFKKINDQFGHDVGDAVLIDIAKLLKMVQIKEEFIGRWGGDEFIIILEGALDAVNFAERLRKRIEMHDFEICDKVTCSFGVSKYGPSDSAKDVLKRADKALYRSKYEGCNRVTYFYQGQDKLPS